MPQIIWPTVGRSQEAEFRIGNTRYAGFVPEDCPFTTGMDSLVSCIQTWNPGWTVTYYRQDDPLAWCNWDHDNATDDGGICNYSVDNDEFTPAETLSIMTANANAQGALSAANPDRWYFPTVCLLRTFLNPYVFENNPSGAPTDDATMARMVTYVGTQVRNAFLAGGGRADRFLFWIFPQVNVSGPNNATAQRQARRVLGGLLGQQPSTGLEPVEWMAGPLIHAIGDHEGTHNLQPSNIRIGISVALEASRRVGGKNLVSTPHMATPWRVDSDTIRVPFFHGDGHKIDVPPTGMALRFAAGVESASSGTMLTVDSVDTSDENNGKTVFVCSHTSEIPAGSYIFCCQDNVPVSQREPFVVLTPQQPTPTRADVFDFDDLYDYIPPALMPVPGTYTGIQLSETDPDEPWNGAVDRHPSDTGEPPTANVLSAVDLGNGSIRVQVGATNCAFVLVRLRSGSTVLQEIVPISGTATVTFDGLTEGRTYRPDVTPLLSVSDTSIVVT